MIALISFFNSSANLWERWFIYFFPTFSRPTFSRFRFCQPENEGRGNVFPLLQFRRRDLLGDERFDDVTDFIIAETLDRDPAFVSLMNLADVFFEASQAADVAFENDHVVADEARMRGSSDRAVRHHAAGDGADLRHADNVADFGLADDGIFVRRLYQSDH